jgi:iron transport multicopper oxidase
MLVKKYQTAANVIATEPVPDSILINDGQATNYVVKRKEISTFKVFMLTSKAGKKYLFRIINMGAFPAFLLNIEGHNMTVVAIDGVYTERTIAQTLNIGTGQRFNVLVTANLDASKNFDISALIDMSAFNPITLSVYNGTQIAHASLDYSSEAAASQPRSVADLITLLPPIDDITIAPLDGQVLLGPVDQHIELLFNRSLSNGVPR